MQDDVIRGRFLVGADGVNSQVRRMTSDAGWFRTAFAIEANVRRNAQKEDLVFDFAPVMAGYGWVFPKRDHVNVGLYSLDKDEKLNRTRLSAYIAQRFGNDVRLDNFVGQHAGFGAAQHRVEKNRVFLVGDAGGFVDLLTGEGIYGAVISGQAAATAILADLDEKSTSERDVYWSHGESSGEPPYCRTCGASFYANPERGFRAMKTPLLRSAILKELRGWARPGLNRPNGAPDHCQNMLDDSKVGTSSNLLCARC